LVNTEQLIALDVPPTTSVPVKLKKDAVSVAVPVRENVGPVKLKENVLPEPAIGVSVREMPLEN
jgi:hypothetical protein